MGTKKFGIEGTEDWIEVTMVDYGQPYEWDEAYVFYNPADKKFYWAYGSGCSCDWISSYYSSIGDFEVGDRKAAIAFIQEYVTGSYRGQETDRQNEADKIRFFKP